MYNISLSIVLFITLSLSTTAQDITIYYDGDWNKVSTADSAVYYNVCTALDSYGNPIGRYTSYYESGRIQMIGQYINGRRSGGFTWYYENGDYKETGNYKNGEYSIVNTWDEEGNTIVLDGDGEYISYYYNKSKKSQGYYKRSKKSGVWNYWYKSGKRKEKIEYKNGVENVIAAWDKDGKPLVENGTGEYTGYFDNGVKKANGMYKEGKKEGVWEWWDEQGKPTTISNYEVGIRNGKTTFYSTAGREEIDYKNGLKNGDANGYDMNDDKTYYNIYRNDTLLFGQIGFMEGNELYTQVEKMPYPDYKTKEFFNKNVVYPSMQLNSGEEGIVYLSFTVNKDGKIENVSAYRSSGKKDFDDEAVRVYQLLPPWVPGEHNGKNVNVKITTTFSFGVVTHKIE